MKKNAYGLILEIISITRVSLQLIDLRNVIRRKVKLLQNKLWLRSNPIEKNGLSLWPKLTKSH